MYRECVSFVLVILCIYFVITEELWKHSDKNTFQKSVAKSDEDIKFDRICQTGNFPLSGAPVNIDNRITVVSAYFNLGNFQKGSRNLFFTPDLYLRWASVFHYILNPLVMYTDDVKFANLIRNTRRDTKEKTIVILINSTTSWAFQLKETIQKIYNQPGYPKHHPNTVLPGYSCAMHAKFEVVADAVRKNYFNTRYYQWLDIGLFRSIVEEKKYFFLQIPTDFNEKMIGYSLVNAKLKNPTFFEIIKNNMVWVGGATFIGKWDTLLKFSDLYKKAVHVLIQHNLMSTDQQVLYAIYSEVGREVLNPNVELQLYNGTNYNPWFYLAYHSRKVIVEL